LPKPVLFDRYASGYRQSVESSIGFVGRDLEFFTRAKVYHLRRLARSLPRPLAVSSVLDVGCGCGLTDEMILPYVGDLTGVDVSSAMVGEAALRNPDAHYEAYDGLVLPFPSDSFDVVFAICVVHHVDPAGWDGLLAEMWRVTRAGGLSVVIEHNPANPLTRRSVDRCPFDEDAVLVGPRRLAQGLRRAGARSVRHRYILFAPFGGDRARMAEGLLGWLPAGAQHIVWAQR
jgi:SAM-dependent methyltransferase